LEVFLHLRPDCSVELGEKGTGVNLRSPEGALLYAWVLEGGGKVALPEILIGTNDQRAAWFSPCYGVRVPARVLRVRREFIGQTDLVTCLSTSNHSLQALVEKDQTLRVEARRWAGSKETLFYRTGADWSPKDDNVRFDGQLLYRREMAGAPSVLWAGDFRELSVEGLLDVHSPASIESLIFENGHCEIVLPPERKVGLRIWVQEGIRLVINGCPAPITGSVSHAT
jgi:hypothetical protein